MSRIASSHTTRKAGKAPQQELQEAFSREFDLRLIRSFVDFLNGASSAESFSWVPGTYKKAAAALGFSNVPEKFSASKIDDETLREQTRQTYLGATYLVVAPDRSAFGEMMSGFVNQQMRTMQVVNCWRIRDGKLVEISLPVLDTIPRCCIYALGLTLLDRHGLRESIRPCLLDIESHTKRHWFFDPPGTKTRKYCCEQHRTRDSKRKHRSHTKETT